MMDWNQSLVWNEATQIKHDFDRDGCIRSNPPLAVKVYHSLC